MVGVVVESGAVRIDELAVDDAAGVAVVGLHQQLGQSLEERLVTADADLQEGIRDGDTGAEHAVHILGILEPQQSSLGQWVDRDDLRTVDL